MAIVGKLTETLSSKILEKNIIGRLGYTDGEEMYVIPIFYLYYDQKYIFAHSREGEKIEALRAHPKVCLQVDHIGNFNEWESVLIHGRFEELTQPKERYYALDLLIRRIEEAKADQKNTQDKIPQVNEFLPLPDHKKCVVYRILITEKQGRFERLESED